MGSVFKPNSVSSTPVSKPAAPSKYIDEVNGIEQVPVTNDDGSITYITRRLELSDEEKLQQQKLTKMADDALAEIQAISSDDYIYSSSIQNALDNWQTRQLDTLSETFDKRKESETDTLAKRGLSDSTAANTVSRQTKQDEYDAKKEIESEKSEKGEALRVNELSNQYSLYNLAKSGLDDNAASAVSNGMSTVNAINASNVASLNDYYANNSALNGTGMFINNILDPLSQQAGETSSGALDSAVGGFMSTITGGLL